eukprot:14030789-Alexandrium_andersonii.AAC.1
MSQQRTQLDMHSGKVEWQEEARNHPAKCARAATGTPGAPKGGEHAHVRARWHACALKVGECKRSLLILEPHTNGQ